MTLAPGSTIGIIGGGQLGRMLAIAAAQLGYKCHIFDPHEHPCAADVAAKFTRAAYDDRSALEKFGAQVDVATYEFENLPVEPLRVIGDKLRPGVKSLSVAQDRAVEKEFIEQCGATGRAVAQRNLTDVERAVAELGTPIVLKTRRYGYDGKGQAWVREAGEAEAAWDLIGRRACGRRNGDRVRCGILGHRRALGRRAHSVLGQSRQRPPRRHLSNLDRSLKRHVSLPRSKPPAPRRPRSRRRLAMSAF